MLQLIASIIFFLSLSGVAFMLYRKFPVLATLPQNGKAGFRKHDAVVNFQKKVKELTEYFDHIAVIHKIVSWVKILVLKVEVKVDNMLHNIRKEAKIKNGKKSRLQGTTSSRIKI